METTNRLLGGGALVEPYICRYISQSNNTMNITFSQLHKVDDHEQLSNTHMLKAVLIACGMVVHSTWKGV